MATSKDWLGAVAGGISGYLGGTDGGAAAPTAAAPAVRAERIVLDQSQPDKMNNQKKQGMDTQTILMIGGAVLLVVVGLVMVKK